ncbi:MAG: S46 family peptidase [Bacteroidales bacterium]|nr:S46 family peptidase [Bacteroidales bacterium]
MKSILVATFILIFILKSLADEGMWIPMLLNQSIIQKMKEKGFKLSAEDIYSINKASMKDAVVLFGRGCTGEFISDKGLLLTNHHCGYGSIQRHSTLEHDYLADGFWAKSFQEELPNPGLTVSLLVRMEDVTHIVLANVQPKMTEAKREEVINTAIQQLKTKYSENNRYQVEVKPFYYGNQYFMFIYEVFKDVRLVGAPPSSIGKFGGDTDNWMWPRHTGDFALFRVYANKNNEPAEYSPDNVPYKPKKFFSISLKGVNENDFTMVFGFPGTTQQYIPSYAIDVIQNVENPHQIKLRDIRLQIIKSAMDTSRLIRIQYANKQASIANSWKKWIGENEGLKRLQTIKKKQEFEQQFENWAAIDPDRHLIYEKLLPTYQTLYAYMKPLQLIETYYFEALFAVEIIQFCSNVHQLLNHQEKTFEKAYEIFLNRYKNFYKNYQPVIDMLTFQKLMNEFTKNISKDYIPKTLLKWQKKYKNDWAKVSNTIYQQSILIKPQTIEALKNSKEKNIRKILFNDPFYKLWLETRNLYNTQIQPYIKTYQSSIDSLNRIYIHAQMELLSDKDFYPDANLTLRVSYGNIKGYTARDGIYYHWQTTINGIIEKDDTTVYDYIVPKKLKELWQAKDYGEYGINGTLPVCFIANNHTTGGNSGSPVLNANGELIGCNFDRTWESTMSDLHYDPNRCRNICLDVRYMLFIIDKFANAKHLIDEMTIVK